MKFSTIQESLLGLIKGSENRQDELFEKIKDLPGDEEDKKKFYHTSISNLQNEIRVRITILIFFLVVVAVFIGVYVIKPAFSNNVDYAAGILVKNTDDDNKYLLSRDSNFNYSIWYKNSSGEKQKLGDLNKMEESEAVEILYKSKTDDNDYLIIQNEGKPFVAYKEKNKVLGKLGSFGNVSIEKYIDFKDGIALYKPNLQILKDLEVGEIKLDLGEVSEPLNLISIDFEEVITLKRNQKAWKFHVKINRFQPDGVPTTLDTPTNEKGTYTVQFSEDEKDWSEEYFINRSVAGELKGKIPIIVGKKGWKKSYSVLLGIGKAGCQDPDGICDPYDKAYNINIIANAISVMSSS